MITVKGFNSKKLPKYYLEKRAVFDKPYIKVFISDVSLLQTMCSGLSGLEEVRKVNVTEVSPASAISNPASKTIPVLKPSLTVYPERFYSVEDCLEAVDTYLSRFTPNLVEHAIEKKSEAHFEIIEQQILDVLENAQAMIDVCVAWFTNKTLRDKLLAMQAKGIRVRVIIYDDGINARNGVDLTGIDYKFVKASRSGIMHKKYCVVDNSIVISGSYNWTTKAEHRNDEDITIEKNDIKLASSFTRDFNKMWGE